MNPFAFAVRRPMTTLLLVVALIGGGIVGLNEMHADTALSMNTTKDHINIDHIGTRVKQAKELSSAARPSACSRTTPR
jgi:membrane fusion protein (multidrug efflux system)